MRYKCYGHQDEIRQWAAEGLGISQIAHRLGVGRRHVRNFLRNMDIPVQKQSHAGAANPAWRGGRVIDKDGYILVKADAHPGADRHGYVREHRLAMEEQLGRYLLPTEVVDHIDGQRSNNSHENLRVFATNRDHLQATLKGRVPKWSPEGEARMKAMKREPNGRLLPIRDADPSPETIGPTQA